MQHFSARKDSTAHTRVLLGPAARMLAAIAMAGVFGAAGCAGHQSYTQAHKSSARLKMDGLKAATEHQMALQAFHSGDLQKALKHCDYSITLNDKVVRSQLLRGRIMLEMGNLEDSAAAFAKARELGPEDAEVFYYTGLLAERVNDSQGAVEAFTKACELDTSNPQYAIAAAENMIDLKQINQADAFLVERADQFKHNPGIRQLRGHIQLMRGNPDAAAKLFADARLLAPDDASITEDLARTQIEIGEFGQAEANLLRLLKRPEFAERIDLKILRSECLIQLGRVVDARSILIDVTNTDEGATNIEAWTLLAKVSLEVNDLGRARQAAARLVALQPKQPEGYVLRAMVQRQAGELAEAQASLERAIAIRPDAPTLTLFGMILSDQGNHAAAGRAYAKALQIDPAYEPAQRLSNASVATQTTGTVTDANSGN